MLHNFICLFISASSLIGIHINARESENTFTIFTHDNYSQIRMYKVHITYRKL